MGNNIKLDFPAGIVRDDTQYRSEGKWWDSDKVRFRNGLPEMIGGWRRVGGTVAAGPYPPYFAATAGTPLVMHHQLGKSSPGSTYDVFFLGTTTTLYLGANQVSTFLAMSESPPTSFTVALSNNPITTVAGNNYIYANMSGRVRVGDYVVLSGSAAIGGDAAATINTAFIVTTVGVSGYPEGYAQLTRSAISYAGAGPGGGAAVVATIGWAPTGGAFSGNRVSWSFVEYGYDTVIGVYDGAILYFGSAGGNVWYLAQATAAYPASGNLGYIANQVPVVVRGISSGKDQSLIAFGANEIGTAIQNKRFVRWSDQEDPSDWEPREDNTAGGFELFRGTEIIAWMKTKREHIIWTDTAIFSMTWVGFPYYYSFDAISDQTQIISNRAAIAHGEVVYWMGLGQFYMYDGTVRVLPCPVVRYVFSGLNRLSTHQIVAGLNPDFNEIWWFYPSEVTPGVGNANDRYVVYNYVENVWVIGSMARTAWYCYGASSSAPGTVVLASDGSYLIMHEQGYADFDEITSNNIAAYIESGDMDIAEGDDMQQISRIIPDHGLTGNTAGTMSYQFKTRDYPRQTLTSLPAESITSTTYWKDLRIRARNIVARYASNANDFKWSLGRVKLETQTDGKRG